MRGGGIECEKAAEEDDWQEGGQVCGCALCDDGGENGDAGRGYFVGGIFAPKLREV